MILSKEQFRRKVVNFIDENWMDIFKAAEVAAECGYTEAYFNILFKEYFGVSFLQYLTRYKLQRAAQIISETNKLTGVGRLIGYANPQSFSKAFKKAFGVSPKEFLKSDMEIPAMPDLYYIEGNPVKVVREQIEEMTLHASPVDLIYQGNEMGPQHCEYFQGFLEEYLDHAENKDDCIGLWWHDEQCSMRYVIGNVAEPGSNAPKGKVKITIPSDYYTVFSVKFIGGGYKPTISDVMNQLYTYVIKEWLKINKKEIDIEGVLYQHFLENEIFLYVPLLKRKQDAVRKNVKRGPDAWVRYIDDHIIEDISVVELAEYFNYSVRHFSNSFELYFGIRPGRYLEKRRLYLAASELKKNSADIRQVVDKFGLESVNEFWESFYEEYFAYLEEFSETEYSLENLQEYYMRYKDSMVVSYTTLQNFSMYGTDVSVKENDDFENYELIERIVMGLKSKNHSEKESMVVVWKTLEESREVVCLLGVEGSIPHSDEKEYIDMDIKGGLYVVLESRNSSDADTLKDTYRMLYRCAFEGWIRENQVRVDFHRLTFVRYHKEKLYFYIPLKI